MKGRNQSLPLWGRWQTEGLTDEVAIAKLQSSNFQKCSVQIILLYSFERVRERRKVLFFCISRYIMVYLYSCAEYG